jgi:hypothetical protein
VNVSCFVLEMSLMRINKKRPTTAQVIGRPCLEHGANSRRCSVASAPNAGCANPVAVSVSGVTRAALKPQGATSQRLPRAAMQPSGSRQSHPGQDPMHRLKPYT